MKTGDPISDKFMWSEKYRPKSLDDLILPDDYRKKFASYIKEKNIPHLLFYGGPGGGKTCLARILTESIIESKADLLYINGSVNNGVDFIRNVVEEFISVPSFGGTPRIVFYDEADRLSPSAQDSLKPSLETYCKYSRFIFTCNELYKITIPLQSRFHMYKFEKLSKEFIFSYVTNILNLEKVQYVDSGVQHIIGLFYPDVRRILNTISSKVVDEKLSSSFDDLYFGEADLIESTKCLFSSIPTGIEKKIYENLNKIKDILSKCEIDFVHVYKELFDSYTVSVWVKPIINDYCNRHQTSLSHSMNYMAFIYDSVKAGRELSNILRNKNV